MYRCDRCGYETYEKSNYKDGLCISCRKGNPILCNEEEMKKIKRIEKNSIVMVIAFLRMLTHGEGLAWVEVFDAGAGGGFSNASIFIDLLRTGSSYESDKIFSIKEFYKTLERLTDPFSNDSKGFYSSLMYYYKETLDEIEKEM